MKGKVKLLGHEINISPTETNSQQINTTKDKIRQAAETLAKYKSGKSNLEKRIVEEEQWYRLNYWDYIRANDKNNANPEPVTGHIFKIIANKHADAMDNYPEPNLLPRNEQDEKEAQNLTKIIPKVLAENKYKTVYDDSWWYKIKHGFVINATLWNGKLAGGLGDIDIVKLDALNVFWEPGVTDIQKSRNLFIVDLQDTDLLKKQYPQLENMKDTKIIDIKQYVNDDTIDITNKSVVVDWYYKGENENGDPVVHLCKFVGDQELYCSENDQNHPEYATDGFYNHGLYPVDIDVLFPIEGTPVGFGYLAVALNPQMYIDKLDQIITRNAAMSGKKRWFAKEHCGINEQEFLDWSKDIIHTTGNVSDDNLREFTTAPLPPFIADHRQNKILELKEITGDRDFQSGGTAGGVTAASAIAMLQEAGNKLSRDMIQRSYACFVEVVYKCISLIDQFYFEEREFRIDQPDGSKKYIKYSNELLRKQPLPQVYEGEEPKYRQPVFDISVKPERQSPFSKIASNELAKELFKLGFFNPQLSDQALVAMELMSFEGKEKVLQMIGQNGMLYKQLQQAQQQMAEMKATMDKMAVIVQHLTGRNMAGQEVQAPTPDKIGGVPNDRSQVLQG